MSLQSQTAVQVGELRDAVTIFATTSGERVVNEISAACQPMLQWLHYLNAYERTETADGLLDGVSSSIREGAACAALGLVRPALFALRTQVDLLLGWLYFKDHPVEWKSVNERGEGFKMKRELIDYLADFNPGYKARFVLLQEVAKRTELDPYRLLSAHIHAQSSVVLPDALNLKDVVKNETVTQQFSLIVVQVNEYISDALVALFAPKWASLPDAVIQEVAARLATKKNYKERFFSGI